MYQIGSRIFLACALFIACLHAGCVGTSSSQTSQANSAALAEAKEMQSVVMVMADDWIMALGESMYKVQSNPAADFRMHLFAVTALRNGISSSLDIAVGPNPRVSMLDLLVLSALQQWSLGKSWQGFGISAEVMKGVHLRLSATRKDMVDKAQKFLTATQLKELQHLIDVWIAANPDQELVAFVRLNNFAADDKILPPAEREIASGLMHEVEQVTSAVEDARFLGERALWYASRYPFVIGLQAEFTTYRLASTLTKELDKQRDTLFDRVAKERSEVVRAFDDHRDSFAPMLAEARDTIKSAEALSGEITKLVAALDALTTRFDRHDGLPGLTAQDLKDVIHETGVSAEKLTALVNAGDSMLEARKLSNAESEANRLSTSLVNRVLWGLAGIVALFIGGLALVRLIPQRTK